jgi:hypothetical protein
MFYIIENTDAGGRMAREFGTFIFFLIILAISPLHTSYAEDKAEAVLCTRCQMKIENSAKKFSVSTPGRLIPVVFDDIECAIKFRNELCAMETLEFDNTAIAYDFYTGENVKMADAVYVSRSAVKTPMGSGIIAFKDRASAESFLAGHGQGEIVLLNDVTNMVFKNQVK